MIKYIKNLPVLFLGIYQALANFNTYDNPKQRNGSNLGKKAEHQALNAQRVSYWSGSSKIYRG